MNLRDLFHLNNREKNGFIVLICLILILQLIRFYILNSKNNTKNYSWDNNQEFLYWVNSIENNYKNNVSIEKNKNTNFSENKKLIKIETIIDINNIPDSIIKNLSISNTLKNSWINYRKKGGKFYNIEDIKKLYGMNDSIFSILKPYLMVNFDSFNVSNRYKIKNQGKIEINKASRSTLFKIIEDYEVVDKILSYRKALGGFYTIEQLNEIENFNHEIIKKLTLNFYVDTSNIKKIDLNKVSFYILSNHPYIKEYNAKKIIRFRDFNKNITFDDLKKHNLMSDSLINKLKPYVN